MRLKAHGKKSDPQGAIFVVEVFGVNLLLTQQLESRCWV